MRYRAYYPGASTHDVLTAQERHFPMRSTVAEAIADVQRAWHNPGHFDHEYATQLTVFEIDGDTVVTERAVKVKREAVLI